MLIYMHQPGHPKTYVNAKHLGGLYCWVRKDLICTSPYAIQINYHRLPDP